MAVMLLFGMGGNNDFSFYESDLAITILDPHRPGDELNYYPWGGSKFKAGRCSYYQQNR